MSADRDIDEVLAAWLRPGPDDAPGRLVASIEAEVVRTAQRRRFPGIGGVRPTVGLGRLAAVVVMAAVALVAASWLAGRDAPAVVGGPSVSPAPSSAAPAASTSPGPRGTLVLTADNVVFDQTDLYWPADTAITILLDSKEAVPHGLDISDAAGTVVFSGTIFVGPAQRTYGIPALAAGTHAFTDPVHPLMTGTLHVGQSAPPPPSAAPEETLPPQDIMLTVSATGFSPDAVSFAGGRRFSIELVNNDPGVEHGIRILFANGDYAWEQNSITGPATIRYSIDALPDGSYTIVDPKHPDVRATLTIGS